MESGNECVGTKSSRGEIVANKIWMFLFPAFIELLFTEKGQVNNAAY